MAKRISVVNHKGGVGKTTTVVNLAVSLALKKKRVLVVDFGPQGNASHFLGLLPLLQQQPDIYGAADFVQRSKPFEPQRNVLVEGLDVIPTTQRLATVEASLYRLDMKEAARRLSRAVQEIEGDYDFILTDTDPGLGLLVLNALVACPDLIAPIKLDPASIPGTIELYEHVKGVRDTTQPDLRFFGAVATFYSENITNRKPKELLGGFADIFGDVMFNTVIHASSTISNAVSFGKPIVLLDPKARGALEYNRLTDEVIARG